MSENDASATARANQIDSAADRGDESSCKFRVSVCAILKDEWDLPEWVAYHVAIGVDHFYLYDNHSKVPIRETLSAFSDVVTVIPFDNTRHTQVDAYSDFLRRERDAPTTEWAAFIDADEFIVVSKHANVNDLMREYADADSLGLHRFAFDAAGYCERAPALMIESYVRREARVDHYVKKIVRPDRLNAVNARMHVHNVDLRPGTTLVDIDTLRRPQPMRYSLPGLKPIDGVYSHDIASVYHYHNRSMFDWHVRMQRGQPNRTSKRTMKQYWSENRAPNKKLDTSLAGSHWPERVRRELAARGLPTPTPMQSFVESRDTLIVSLTSTSFRVAEVHRTIESLLAQTRRPDRIILWLSEEAYLKCKGVRKDSLPATLLALQDANRDVFSIEWTRNTGSFRKLVPTVRAHPNAWVITVDDDTVYGKKLVETLATHAAAYPRCVVSNRSRAIGSPSTPYAKWMFLRERGNPVQSMSILPTGIGGVLYPPGALDEHALVDEHFMKACPTADDLWFRAATFASGLRVLHTGSNFLRGSFAQEERLYSHNHAKNNEYWRAACEAFGVTNPHRYESLIIEQREPLNNKSDERAKPSAFNTNAYWDSRYVSGSNSGRGSRGSLAQFKADVVNELIRCNDVKRLVDFGVGDGHQLSLLTDAVEYVGLDVSRHIVNRLNASPLVADRPNRSVHRYDGTRVEMEALGITTADVALSMDVIFHLMEGKGFDAYMSNLWHTATRFVVIYSSNLDNVKTGCKHVRHRRWSNWLETNVGADSYRIYRVAQRHACQSFADFYIVDKRAPASEPPLAMPSFELCEGVVDERDRATINRLFDGVMTDGACSDYARHARELVKIVVASERPLEGNVLFRHHTARADLTLDRCDATVLGKRKLLAASCQRAGRAIEIGFNSGFSALILLIANRSMSLVVFDTFEHAYAEPCFQYLSSRFPGRLTRVNGNTRTTLPEFVSTHNASFDFFHVDGGNAYATVMSDLLHCKRVATRSAVVVLNDFNFSGQKRAWNECKKAGIVKSSGESMSSTAKSVKYVSVASTFA